MSLYQHYTLGSRNDTRESLAGRIVSSYGLFAISMFLADVSVIIGLSYCAGVAYHLIIYGNPGIIANYLTIGALASGVFSTLNLLNGEYALRRVFFAHPQFTRTFYLWGITFIVLLVFGFLAKQIEDQSRAYITILYVVAIPALYGLRRLAKHVVETVSRAGSLRMQRIFLFGEARGIREFTRCYEQKPNGTVIAGCHFINTISYDAPLEQKRHILLREIDVAVAAARDLAPDAVILLIPWSDAETIEACAEAFLVLPAEIHLGADQIIQRYNDVHFQQFGALATLRLTRAPMEWLDLTIKRLFDIVVAAIGLFALTPAMLLVAAAIKFDSEGPAFFLQRRFGFNQRPFRIVKFRTMHTMDDGDVVKQAKRNDSRITRVGRILRRWSIDELPQLFNVIIGDMSLVGPRPHALSHDREYGRKIAVYARRHNVKPGITGWAQVNGLRGETDTEEKMERRVVYDLYYIENWSVLFDIRILVRTVFSPATYRNAY